MIDWVAAAFTSAKTAGDIAKSLITLRDEDLVRGRVMDLTSTLMDLQQQMMQGQMEQIELISKIASLEEELRTAKQKSDVLGRYELLALSPGQVVYTLKPQFKDVEPDHFCCTNCYDMGRRSVLKPQNQLGGTWIKYICPACSNAIGVIVGALPESMRGKTR
ncbi:hypothetical protein [Pseudomonas salomonii]|uniref:hypothetical protein n=1 Tax=Pseudomonas salomonii TaxID=191391 RepID=UPI00085289DB|nr:hypothetical protein [Pseudomonas salomonii]